MDYKGLGMVTANCQTTANLLPMAALLSYCHYPPLIEGGGSDMAVATIEPTCTLAHHSVGSSGMPFSPEQVAEPPKLATQRNFREHHHLKG